MSEERKFWLHNKQYTMFDAANLTAKYLLECGCVQFRPDDPFEFRSGRKSPIYVDVAKVLGTPRARADINMMSYNKIFEVIGNDHVHYIAGGESRGIPFATMIAERLHKPLCYVRKEAKGYGMNDQIVGLTDEQLAIGRKIILVEDLCSEGGSKKVFIDAIRRSANIITDVFAVFSYGCFGAAATLQADGVRLISLTDANTLIDVADDIGWSTKEVRAEVRKFLIAPNAWGETPTPGTEAPGAGLTHQPPGGT